MSAIASKLYWSIRLRGVVETGLCYANSAIGRLRREAAGCDPQRRSEIAFDKRFGVQTAGVVETGSLGLPDAAASHSVEYRPSSDVSTAVALASLPINHARYRFLDIGCGRGRVLFVADLLSFAGVTGVELSPHLAADARRNVEAFIKQRSALDDRPRVFEVLEQDATTIELPNEPLVVYLYNPFDATVLTPFISHVERSLDETPRECWIVYANAIHRHVLDDNPHWTEHAYGDTWWGIYRFQMRTSSTHA